MTDIQAAVGREQLKRLPEIIETRRKLAGTYRSLLSVIADLEFPDEPNWARSNWQSFCVRLPDGRDQRMVMQRMLDEGVSTRRGIMCSHREPAYTDLSLRSPLRRSELAQDRSIVLPLYPQMTAAEQERVATALRRSCRD
jgi:perosamine synthetase